MADIIYKYVLTDGSIYIGRDKVHKYKRAVDHMQNALAVGFAGTKYDGHFLPMFVDPRSGMFSIQAPQSFEQHWGQIIKSKTTDPKNADLLYSGILGTESQIANNLSFDSLLKENPDEIIKNKKENFKIGPRDVGLSRWCYISATTFCNSIEVDFSPYMDNIDIKKQDSVKKPLTYIIPRIFTGQLGDVTNFTEFIITAKYYSNLNTATQLLNKEAGDYTSFIKGIYDENGNLPIDTKILHQQALNNIQTIFKQQLINFGKDNKNQKTTLDVKINIQNLLEPIMKSSLNTPILWNNDTKNMFSYTLTQLRMINNVTNTMFKEYDDKEISRIGFEELIEYFKYRKDFLATHDKIKGQHILSGFINQYQFAERGYNNLLKSVLTDEHAMRTFKHYINERKQHK